MAKEEKTIKVTLERVYNVPLRRGFSKAPAYRRTPRAMRELRTFLQKHMKSERVRIGPALNSQVWARGIKAPPHHVKVNAAKMESGEVNVELFGAVKFWELVPTVEEKKAKKPAKATVQEETQNDSSAPAAEQNIVDVQASVSAVEPEAGESTKAKPAAPEKAAKKTAPAAKESA